MINNDYIYLVGDNLLNAFSSVFIVDIRKDIVNEFVFENTSVKLKKSDSFMNFLENPKLLVHPDDNEKFISIISWKFEESISTVLKRAGIYSNESNVLIAKKINNNNNELNMITLIKTNEMLENENIESIDSEALIEDFSEVILKIYNTIDMTKENIPALDYIKTLLKDLNKKYPKLNSSLEKNIINEVNKSRNTLLIVDDDILTRNILKKTFEKDFDIVIASNGKEAIDILEDNYKNNSDKYLNFVGIFLDIEMPVLNGFAVLDYLEQRNLINKMPVIIISGVEDKEIRQKVYNYNIADMLEKPFNLEIIRLRINNFIRLFKSSNSLSNLIVNNDMDINRLVNKIEKKYFRDYEKNINLVSKLTELLAKKHLNNYPNCGLTSSLIEKVINASKYYNIGRILIPNNILDKSNLNDEERNELLEYTKNSELLIKRIFIDKDPILAEYALNIAKYHNDTLENSEYSKKYVDKNIPVYLSIVSLVILYVKYVLDDKEVNDSVIATNIIALENIQFSSEIIDTFRTILSEFSNICRNDN